MNRLLSISLLLILSCTKDNSEKSPFNSPAFFQGQWKSPPEEFSDGSTFTWYEFEFTNQTVVEINHLYQNTIDYKQTFPADKFEIVVQKSDNDFEITITSKTGDAVPYSFMNQFYRRFSRLSLRDGSEGIELRFGGTSGAYVIRK
jgi:hypothetical protein